MRHLQIALLFAVVVVGMPLLPLLAQNAGGRATPPMSMGMMEKCQENCDTMSATMADLTRTIAAARTSKDVPTLQAALDHAQAGVAKMESQQQECRAMMDQMHQMMPMTGPASH